MFVRSNWSDGPWIFLTQVTISPLETEVILELHDEGQSVFEFQGMTDAHWDIQAFESFGRILLRIVTEIRIELAPRPKSDAHTRPGDIPRETNTWTNMLEVANFMGFKKFMKLMDVIQLVPWTSASLWWDGTKLTLVETSPVE
jgi:hypothetical protein